MGWYFNISFLKDETKTIKRTKRIKRNNEISYFYFIIADSVSGFLFGDEIVEIRSFGNVLSNLKRWIILIFFSLFFNILLYFGDVGFEISISFLISYFISNLIPIYKGIKIPVDTIVNSLTKEGFKGEHLEQFIYQKYYRYFYIYIFAFGLILAFKCILMKYSKK